VKPMVWHRQQTAIVSLVALVTGSLPEAASAAIYRFVDENGRTVFASSVPQRYIGNGYTVLNDQGQVVEVVPPLPSATAMASRQAEEAQRLQQEQAENAQTEADNLLLRLYREPADITRRRDERLRQVDTQVALASTQLNEANSEKEKVSLVIAGYRLRNEDPPQENLGDLERAERSVAEAEQRIAELNATKDEINASAAGDEARLRNLLGLPENTGAE
jgi:hypothetical protein